MAQRKPELLAPAGSLEMGLTAFDYGADAVYAGLGKFNARERARNLSQDDLGKLIEYAHQHGRRVYVTLNTLVKEQELPAVADMITSAAGYGPDAFIVQDLGILRMLRQGFPGIPVHASTQMGIHNSAGINVLRTLGVSRCILQRQISLEELRLIQSESPIELEVFVHGALCCSRSGSCLFSSWLGGWSGNRGKCKQPCRRRFYSESGNGFFFSPRDLCLVETVPELAAMGIASLKIEGRLRGSDYVRKTVSAYRKVIDTDAENQGEVLRSVRHELGSTLSRKPSHGFTSAKSMGTVIDHTVPGAAGKFIGKILQVTDRFIELKLSGTLYSGDRIRIQPLSGDEGPLLQATHLSVGRRNVKRARKGDVCRISCRDVPVHDGQVYLIGPGEPDFSKRIAQLPTPKNAVSLDIQIDANSVTVRIAQLPQFHWEYALSLQPAQNRPLQPETVIAEFAKGQSSVIRPTDITVNVSGAYFMPGAELRSLRKTFWAVVTDCIAADDLKSEATRRLAPMIRNLQVPLNREPVEPVCTVALKQGVKNPVSGTRTCRRIYPGMRITDEVMLPDFCPESELPGLRRQVDELLKDGQTRWRITSLFGLDLFRNTDGLELTVSFPLPVANSLALEQVMELGACRGTLWVELAPEDRETLLKRASTHAEIYAYGRIPILETRARIPAGGTVTDSRGLKFRLVNENGQTLLFPDEVLSEDVSEKISTFVDLTHASPNEELTTQFNGGHPWV